MTHSPMEITEDQFDARYTLRANHLNPHAGWASGDGPGCHFETCGAEWDFVRRQDPRTIWTLVDGEDGDLSVRSGCHFLNRLGYLLSTEPVPEGIVIEVRIPMQDEPSTPTDRSRDHD
jgi:hypothetical protein